MYSVKLILFSHFIGIVWALRAQKCTVYSINMADSGLCDVMQYSICAHSARERALLVVCVRACVCVWVCLRPCTFRFEYWSLMQLFTWHLCPFDHLIRFISAISQRCEHFIVFPTESKIEINMICPLLSTSYYFVIEIYCFVRTTTPAI